MPKGLKALLLFILIVGPIIFYSAINKKNKGANGLTLLAHRKSVSNAPSIALIFDDLGESLADLRDIYALEIPLTVAVIPDLKFSKNIAHIASRCGFSVLIHLPLEPKREELYQTDKYQFISSKLTRRYNISLLRKYLNSIRIAIGVNNHMGSSATENEELMNLIFKDIKKRNLVFIDSRTSPKSIAYKIANENNLICSYNEGFLDPLDGTISLQMQMAELIKAAKQKKKIIVIAHPRKKTIKFLKDELPTLKKEINFITIKDYFEL